MLSAIAARKKAAKEARIVNSSENPPKGIKRPLHSPSSSSEAEPPPPRKRNAGRPDLHRAYSPSRPVSENEDAISMLNPEIVTTSDKPVVDSSEDEDSEQGDPAAVPSKLEISPEERRILYSPFIPRLDLNYFKLTATEIESLSPQLRHFFSNNATILLLKPGCTMSFVGTACITLLQGAVTISGTLVSQSLQMHRIFSPRSSPLVSLEMQSPTMPSQVPQRPNLLHGYNLPQRVEAAVELSHGVVILQPMRTGIEGLGKIIRTFDSIFDVGSQFKMENADDLGIEGLHLVNPIDPPRPQIQSFFLPESWDNALNAAMQSLPSDDNSNRSGSECFIGLVRGPKKCGKSTFARTLLNRLTTRYRHVAFLECDVGQSEFTPGGMVSLHVLSSPLFGPPFTHPRLPYHAHFVGSTTPRSNPSHYLSCIEALAQKYRTDIQYTFQESVTSETSTADDSLVVDDRIEGLVPLVVNTHGWVKGLGGDLLRRIEDIVAATHTFDLDMQQSNALLGHHQTQASGSRLYTLQQIQKSPLEAYYTSADHRSIAMLSYFHSVFPQERLVGAEVVSRWVTDSPLCSRPPWAVDCKEAVDKIILAGPGYEDVVPHELSSAINCGIVALICDDSEPMLDDDRPQQPDLSFPYVQGAPVPDPSTSHCVGLALVRGVDAAKHVLHILTPLPREKLARCRVLVKGELELPVWGMLDFREGQDDGVAGVPWEKVPYLQMGGRGTAGVGKAGVGAERRRVRRNLMRRGQM